jgi:predicted amidohydrolase YtcJ
MRTLFSSCKILNVKEGVATSGDILVERGYILGVGAGLSDVTAKIVEMGGRLVMPSFIDPHNHMLQMGLTLKLFPLYHCQSIREMMEEVRNLNAQLPRGKWIEGKGWIEGNFAEKRLPTRWDVDAVCPDRPVYLERVYNMGVANSLALRMAKIDRNTPNPEGGVIDRGPDGEPTGILRNHAKYLIHDLLPKSKGDMIEAIATAGEDALDHGITMINDPGITPEMFRAYQNAYEEGRLPVRVHLMPDLRDRFTRLFHDRINHLGIHTGFGNRWLRMGALKLSLDGTLEIGTALLHEPYVRDMGVSPAVRIDPEAIPEMFRTAQEAGWSIHIHCCGDKAQEIIVNGYKYAQDKSPNPRVRHCVVHGYIPNEQTLNNMRQYGIGYMAQPIFLAARGHMYEQALGKERTHYVTPLQTYKRHRIMTALSSDVPAVASQNPLLGIHAAMTRKTRTGEVLGESQKVSLLEAICMYTHNAAWMLQAEGWAGSIEPGKVADFIAFGPEFLNRDAEELLHARPDMTVVGGEVKRRAF